MPAGIQICGTGWAGFSLSVPTVFFSSWLYTWAYWEHCCLFMYICMNSLINSVNDHQDKSLQFSNKNNLFCTVMLQYSTHIYCLHPDFFVWHCKSISLSNSLYKPGLLVTHGTQFVAYWWRSHPYYKIPSFTWCNREGSMNLLPPVQNSLTNKMLNLCISSFIGWNLKDKVFLL